MGIRDQGREVVKELVKKFSENYAEYTRSASTYNETLLRVDFLNPFLEALGWDVENKKGSPQHLREVVHEDIVLIGDDERSASKKPDYAFRLGMERKFFLEAKKPSVIIATSDIDRRFKFGAMGGTHKWLFQFSQISICWPCMIALIDLSLQIMPQ